MDKHILIVDDLVENLHLLAAILCEQGYVVKVASSGQQALDSVVHSRPQLILLDVNMPKMNGFEVCRRLQADEKTCEIPIIFLTAIDSVDKISEGLELGAADYVTKPFNQAELLSRVKTHLTVYTLLQERELQNQKLAHKARVALDMLQEIKDRQGGPLLGNSPAIIKLRAQVAAAAGNNESVLLLSAPGCGGEFIARTIHDQSACRGNAFVYVNCSQLSEANIEAIFAEDGTSKMMLASGGTLYLDRINEMPLKVQEEFLRHELQLAGHQVRLISLGSTDLEHLLTHNDFSEELHKLISHQIIPVPCLNERRADIEDLANFFVKHFASLHGKNINIIAPESLKRLQEYNWPGNIAELMTVLEGQVVIGSTPILEIPTSVFYRGEEIGGYHLVKQIASGGMGEVWKAEHGLLAGAAAIKMINAKKLSRSESQKRFLREAKVITKLRSPHTINLYDFGVRDNGDFYYVMELLEGMNLSQLVKKYGMLDYRRLVHFMRQCCCSLVEAHSQGLVHRDIKPSNIYVCCMPSHYDFIKILDFGIAKDMADDQEITKNGALGTPLFLAPEAFRSKSPVTQVIDVYALACIAYWALSGEYLFSGETTIDCYFEHLKKDPVPIREFSENKGIPERLERLLLACLAKNAAERPSSKELLFELVKIEQQHPWTFEEACSWWEQRGY